MLTGNATDKLHSKFDWQLTHLMTLALDLSKMGIVLLGQVNSIIEAY